MILGALLQIQDAQIRVFGKNGNSYTGLLITNQSQYDIDFRVTGNYITIDKVPSQLPYTVEPTRINVGETFMYQIIDENEEYYNRINFDWNVVVSDIRIPSGSVLFGYFVTSPLQAPTMVRFVISKYVSSFPLAYKAVMNRTQVVITFQSTSGEHAILTISDGTRHVKYLPMAPMYYFRPQYLT